MQILNETLVKVPIDIEWGIWWGAIFAFVLGGVAIIGIMGVYNEIYISGGKKHDVPSLIIACFGSAAMVLGMIWAFSQKPVYTQVPQYEVFLDNQIGFHEIYDNYHIIKQRGEIFILQEKIDLGE